VTGSAAIHSTGCGSPPSPDNFHGAIIAVSNARTWGCSLWYEPGVDGDALFLYASPMDMFRGTRPLRPGDDVTNPNNPVPLGPAKPAITTPSYRTFKTRLLILSHTAFLRMRHRM
jgi:hypothetical protein